MKKFKSYEAFLDDLEKSTGYQVYDERTDSSGVKTPYIVCGRLKDNNIVADNTVLVAKDIVDVLLFTVQSNHVIKGQRAKAEAKVKEYLKGIGSIYDTDYDWIENASLHKSSYTVEVWYE